MDRKGIHQHPTVAGRATPRVDHEASRQELGRINPAGIRILRCRISPGGLVQIYLALIAAALLFVHAPQAASAGCACDCDDDGVVHITELIRVMNIALGSQEVSGCVNLPTPCSACVGPVAIGGLLLCVGNALKGCPAVSPTATPIPETKTPTGTPPHSPTEVATPTASRTPGCAVPECTPQSCAYPLVPHDASNCGCAGCATPTHTHTRTPTATTTRTRTQTACPTGTRPGCPPGKETVCTGGNTICTRTCTCRTCPPCPPGQVYDPASGWSRFCGSCVTHTPTQTPTPTATAAAVAARARSS